MAITQCKITKNFTNLESNTKNRLTAAANLGEIAFKLYVYLEAYPDSNINYERIKFVKTMNTNYKSADKALQTLIENGYLIPNENNFIFVPRAEENTRIEF